MHDGEISRREKGNFYEGEVVNYLKKRGYNIIKRNFYSKYGEIDIIAKDEKNKLITFVEVKAREKSTGMHPFEAVDLNKQKKIILAAEEYMVKNNISDYFVRFDVVGVILKGRKIEKIEVAQDAFQQDSLQSYRTF